MTIENVISDINKKIFHPIYWLEGEETYFIDQVIKYAEQNVLSQSEAEFNLTILYGRDTTWADVLNACRRYPMFAERQVVILKEAQTLKDIEKLESYIEKPLSSTLFFVAYKDKKIDGRSKIAKLLKKNAVFISTKKLYENALPEWTNELINKKGFTITSKALHLLIDHIGNDLSRLSNEVDKLALNIGDRKQITEDDIELYIGVSKEFNVFELQQAIAKKDLYKAIRIIQYFAANPKAAPLQLIFPSLYNFFSKLLMVYAANGRDEKTIATAIGVHHFFVKDYIQSAKVFHPQDVERIILLLHQYNLKNLGVYDAGTEDGELLKEMVVKMIGV